MELDFSALAARDAYSWMIDLILPRPIAWVSTVSAAGAANLAPFSFFQGVCARPPTLLFCPANTRDGEKKDTLRNVEAVPEFVVNVVPFALAEKMNATAERFGPGVSEFERCGVSQAPSVDVRPPRVAEAPAAFECRLRQIVRVSDGPLGGSIVIGTIVRLHVDERVLDGAGRPDPARLDLIGRLGGDLYARTTERFSLERP